ncbi:MAG TPA: hypothetical protein VFQ24_10140 [Terriglobia bacterium]|nr:hypothetical protein [Terriglobia bacterium]
MVAVILRILSTVLVFSMVRGGRAPNSASPPQGTSATVHAGISKEELEKETRVDEFLEGASQELRRKDYPKAIKQAESALDFVSQVQDAYRRNRATDDALDYLGKSYIYLREFQQAEEVYHRRLALERKYETFESSIAGNLQMLGMIEGAQGRWGPAISFYLQSSRYLDECIQHYKKSDDYDPQDIVANNQRRQKSELLLYLGAAYSQEGKIVEALRSCDEAYLLGEKFHAQPASLMRIAEAAIGLLKGSGQSNGLDMWQAREKSLRSRIP